MNLSFEMSVKLQKHLKGWILPSLEDRERFLQRCVLSASGLRFIHSGDEEDESSWVCDEALYFVACSIAVYGERALGQGKRKKLWMGHDARPTGPLLMALGKGLLESMGFAIDLMGLGPIPEVMAATHQSGADGFCYFTASHNPKGHNGLKLGFGDGAVLSKSVVTPMIDDLKAMYLGEESELWSRFVASFIQQDLSSLSSSDQKALSLGYYRKFALETVLPGRGDEFLPSLKGALASHSQDGQASHGQAPHAQVPLFLFDMNGSSRLKSVDLDFLKEAGIDVEVMGEEPGVFHHAIIPEGASLEPLRARVQERMDQGRKVLGGMVPDCDGDRGNLILPVEGKAKALKAQETFALCAIAEYSTRRALGEQSPLGLAANGPSSLRLEAILKAYDIRIERAEVGEANVLALASKMRGEGVVVPMSGEGSNGGNILNPSTVRDPLMTLLSLLKFVALPLKKGEDESSASRCVGAEKGLDPACALETVLKKFPLWTSTDAFDGDALMPVPKIDHDVLKRRYEEKLSQHFEGHSEFWSALGVASMSYYSNEGIENIPGPGNRPQPAKGGLQIFLMDAQGQRKGFLWMRGSGTEPVFRVMVDWPGEQKEHDELLALHRALITQSCEG